MNPDSTFVALQTALAGRFSLERELGKGGMGIVYLARDVMLDRQVAIKLLAPSLAARDMRLRFLREARIAAQCFHPHIVPIHAVEESASLAWFVMAYVRGETVAERVRRLGPLPPSEVRRLANEIGWALAYAHQRGLVHRDVKAENILIDAASGRFLMADFGIARASDDVVSTHSGAAGTPHYMAPEQALGESVDGRADLYALGVTLFVAATGRPPFEAANALALIAQHATVPAPPVRQFANALPASLADAIDRCLAKHPDDRFATAEALIDAIAPERSEATEPVALAPVRASAHAARTLVGWTAAVGLSSVCLLLGEPHNSFGYGILVDLTSGLSGAMGFAAIVRQADAIVKARRSMLAGQHADDVERALAGDAREVHQSNGGRWRSFAIAASGVGIALLQGRLSRLDGPSFLLDLLQVATLFGPPFLIAAGVAGVTRGTRLARWLREHVVEPVSRLSARIAGRGIAVRRLGSMQQNAATEVLLDRAVHDLLANLPANVRGVAAGAAEAASALAKDAELLRADDARLADEERAVRLRGGGDAEHVELERIARERAAVRERMATTIAALEVIRLDLLRLAAGEDVQVGLTTHLDAVQALGHRIDAAREVRALM